MKGLLSTGPTPSSLEQAMFEILKKNPEVVPKTKLMIKTAKNHSISLYSFMFFSHKNGTF